VAVVTAVFRVRVEVPVGREVIDVKVVGRAVLEVNVVGTAVTVTVETAKLLLAL
jgi:hypothetical protein